MPKQEGQKTKLLALLHIFEQKTDENHLLNVPQLVELLEQQGILAERKSIYSDIDTLCALGYDIQLRRGRGGGYWMASRAFELSELKLLVDAVQASKVISARTSKKLIRKLEALCSEYEGTQLQRQVYVDGRPKADSRTLLYSIDALHTAISAGRLVQFRYKNNSTTSSPTRMKRIPPTSATTGWTACPTSRCWTAPAGARRPLPPSTCPAICASISTCSAGRNTG